MLGGLHGPMNRECLNATHPAMLAVQRCNSDAQLSYRFPMITASHRLDDGECLKQDETVIIAAAQVAQYGQAGYACDLCIKRQPMAVKK